MTRPIEKYLVVYDYGQGGLWAYIYARSREEILQRIPQLTIVDREPDWMESQRVDCFDLDDIPPGSWLALASAGKT